MLINRWGGVSRESRLAKLASQLEALELAYRATLMCELQKCAAGLWGLFGQNDDAVRGTYLERRLRSPGALQLLELGAEIAKLRADLGREAYYWHERFLAQRALHGSDTLGEPNRAALLLAELDASL
jgi:hypothetical protein